MNLFKWCKPPIKDLENGRDAEPKVSNAKKTIRLMIPYLWPSDNWGVRMRVIFCAITIILSKILIVMIPMQYKAIVDLLNESIAPFNHLLYYAILKFTAKIMDDIRNTVFLKVSQQATENISTKTYAHLHDLGLNYHLNRNTGAILRTIDRGTGSVQTLCRVLLFNIGPTILELFMVCVILFKAYHVGFSLVTFFTITIYVVFTLVVTEWRKKFRRQMNEKDNNTNDKAVDSLINFETIKYFTAEDHVIKRYTDSLREYFKIQMTTRYSLTLLNVGQNFIICLGLYIIMYLGLLGWKNDDLKVGDIVAINLYLLQLYVPLNWLGSSYTVIIQSLINMEKMFEILEEPLDIVDDEFAQPMELDGGEIEFENVSFSYSPDSNPILNNISFVVEKGTMTAIVGSTGAGKSTIFRLLCRFYNLGAGTIYIDGQDISTVNQKSLRRHIGVVPQDTVLFNDTVRYNVAFGCISDREATFEEIENATKGAVVHEFIENSGLGYDTIVGERGLRLSGGEKQRIAIARTILKDPPILILDEATSALDTQTEREIQESLMAVSKGRTTLVIAHRLSTVMDADQILVLNEGKITERGNHMELLELGGDYYNMWQNQKKATSEEEPELIPLI
eukprot:TRINITY_DN1899_c0_g1_i1.p1 TRINITY_DN1899_c0_g1~~TRINITY_DN1899_c0_g1_i1.p1  ORF type:complete len:620 (-),score=117.62 TRINITY_DN1899_c0_g1_i1:20-1879(-)